MMQYQNGQCNQIVVKGCVRRSSGQEGCNATDVLEKTHVTITGSTELHGHKFKVCCFVIFGPSNELPFPMNFELPPLPHSIGILPWICVDIFVNITLQGTELHYCNKSVSFLQAGRMRWEKLSQSCQTIIAWIFLVFVVGTFLALIIMKVTTAEESLFHLVLTTNVFLVLSFLMPSLCVLPSYPPCLLPLLFTFGDPFSSLSTHTHTWYIDISGSSQLSFKT